MDVTVVIPECSEDAVSEWLCDLTEAVCKATGDSGAGGLDGSYAYGANYENDVFKLHRYCWCDSDDCPYCDGSEPNFLHKASGASVSWYKYIGRAMEVSEADWPAIFSECFDSLQAT